MLTVPAGFLAALGSSHGYSATLESYLGGELIGTVPLETGSVSVDARNRVRRRVDLTVPERYWPTKPDDPLSPQGVWLRALVSITSGATAFPPAPVFAGKLLRPTRQRRSGRAAVVAADPMWQVNRESFETPRVAPVGADIVGLVRTLLAEVFPAATLEDQTGSTATVPTTGLVWDAADGSRGQAIDELADSIGAEVFARPTRVWPEADFVIRPVPRLDIADPVWTLSSGPAGVIVNDQIALDGESVVNRWVVMAEPSGGATGLIYATATDEISPARYGGPMGKLVSYYSSPFVGTLEQASAAALAKLARSLGLGDQRTLTVIVNPALEAGDVIEVRVDAEPPDRHIVDGFAVPLSADSPTMTVLSRAPISSHLHVA